MLRDLCTFAISCFDKLKNEMQRFILRFCFYLTMKSEIQIIEIRAPKVPFNFHYKILMKKAIFVYFNFDSKLKIEKRHFFFNFRFSIFI